MLGVSSKHLVRGSSEQSVPNGGFFYWLPPEVQSVDQLQACLTVTVGNELIILSLKASRVPGSAHELLFNP